VSRRSCTILLLSLYIKMFTFIVGVVVVTFCVLDPISSSSLGVMMWGVEKEDGEGVGKGGGGVLLGDCDLGQGEWVPVSNP